MRQGVDEAVADERHHLIEQLRALALRASLQEEAAGDHRDEQCADERDLTSAWHANVQRDGVFER